MDIEQKQADFIDHFVKQASTLHGSALGPLVAEASSNPSLFAFSEILSVPSVLQVRLSLCPLWLCLVFQKTRETERKIMLISLLLFE